VPLATIPPITGCTLRPFTRSEPGHYGEKLLNFLKNDLKIIIEKEREDYCKELDELEDVLIKCKVADETICQKFGRYISIFERLFDELPKSNISFSWGLVEKDPSFHIFCFCLLILIKIGYFLREAPHNNIDEIKLVCRAIYMARVIVDKAISNFNERYSSFATLQELNDYIALIEAWNAQACIYVAFMGKISTDKTIAQACVNAAPLFSECKMPDHATFFRFFGQVINALYNWEIDSEKGKSVATVKDCIPKLKNINVSPPAIRFAEDLFNRIDKENRTIYNDFTPFVLPELVPKAAIGLKTIIVFPEINLISIAAAVKRDFKAMVETVHKDVDDKINEITIIVKNNADAYPIEIQIQLEKDIEKYNAEKVAANEKQKFVAKVGAKNVELFKLACDRLRLNAFNGQRAEEQVQKAQSLISPYTKYRDIWEVERSIYDIKFEFETSINQIIEVGSKATDISLIFINTCALKEKKEKILTKYDALLAEFNSTLEKTKSGIPMFKKYRNEAPQAGISIRRCKSEYTEICRMFDVSINPELDEE
jgi:hypothetical protein